VERLGISYISIGDEEEMIKRLNDTIAAVASPMGEGAISVIRVSGDSACRNVACRFKGKRPLTTVKSHTAHFGRLIDANGNHVDDVICTVFLAPRSYTGEDIVEVSCHGGIHVTRRVLECLFDTGIRPAEPGEFTQRAFLNGKMDLSQAEAVADIIQARADKAYKTSLYQLEGVLSNEIHSIQDRLIKTLGLLELELDFIEEDIELINKKSIEESLNFGINETDRLLKTYKYGKIWREGIRVALIGLPNAGKSSLLNALLNENRAIVTDIPGTTRDFIEEKISLSGILFRIIDTAGLRKTDDLIEQEGVKKTWKVIETADIIVFVHDCTKPVEKNEREFLEEIYKNYNQKNIIFANNKIDLRHKMILQNNESKEINAIETSALHHTGVMAITHKLTMSVLDASQTENKESITITNERHYSALLKAIEGLQASLESLRTQKSGEFIAIDLRLAIDSLGEIIGLVTTEQILNSIFSKFCIGK
jgi:tRNA modification GTPase